MVLHLLIALTEQKNTTLLLPELNHNLSGLIKDAWFNIDFWSAQNAVTGQSKGRNITWFVGYEDDEWVLRHYYRGGLIGKIMNDKYLFTTKKATRCYQELELLEKMYNEGLPVPKPIAARIIKQKLFYQADLLIAKIPDSQDLVHKLQQSSLTEADWHAMGSMIAKFHELGIYHSDLNAHNILIDKDNMFWLIDFDKCNKRVPDKQWQKDNLSRLHRSFRKERKLHKNFNFDSLAWHWLIQGYQNSYHLHRS